jgi:CHAT domain
MTSKIERTVRTQASTPTTSRLCLNGDGTAVGDVEPRRTHRAVAFDPCNSRRRQRRRRLAARQAQPVRDRAPAPVILFLAANPRGTGGLELADECATIQRELRMVNHRDQLRFEARWAVSIDDVMRHVTELEPHVIHFGGHGQDTGILFQESGQPQLVSTRALTMVIGATAQHARVVLLNCCHSAAQAEQLRTETDCVIAMDGAVHDAAARVFATRFYGALGNGRSAGNAFAQGIAALAAHQLPDEWLPRCVTRDGIDAHEIFLFDHDAIKPQI